MPQQDVDFTGDNGAVLLGVSNFLCGFISVTLRYKVQSVRLTEFKNKV